MAPQTNAAGPIFSLRMRETLVFHPAQVAKAMTAPLRLRILTTLLNEESSVSDLAARLDAEHPRISYHLAVLRNLGCVSVRKVARLHLYSLERDRFSAVLSAMERWPRRRRRMESSTRGAVPLPSPQPDRRQARTCYDHLAGAAGVYMLRQCLKRGWLRQGRRDGRAVLEVTMRGAQAFVRRGVNVFQAGQARRRFAFECGDWSDRRHHLAGALGAAIFESLRRAGAIRSVGRSRHLVLCYPLGSWLDAKRQFSITRPRGPSQCDVVPLRAGPPRRRIPPG